MRLSKRRVLHLLLFAACAKLLGCSQSITDLSESVPRETTLSEQSPAVLGSRQDQSQPNIVIFLADDMAWHDVGVYQRLTSSLMDANNTPNIDQLAGEGVVFERAFTATAMCSVARHQIYTGL